MTRLSQTWSPVDGVRDCKGTNLIPDHVIELLLQFWGGFCTLSQNHICIDSLPLDVVVNPAAVSILFRMERESSQKRFDMVINPAAIHSSPFEVQSKAYKHQVKSCVHGLVGQEGHTTCMCAYMYVYICICTCTCTCTGSCVCVCTCISICVCKYKCICFQRLARHQWVQ